MSSIYLLFLFITRTAFCELVLQLRAWHWYPVSMLNGSIEPKTLWEKVGMCDMSLIAHKPQDHLTWWETCYVLQWGLQWGKKSGAYWTPQDVWLCLESDSIWSHNTPRYYWTWLSPLLICIWCFHTAGMWMLTPIHETDWQWTSLIFQEDIMDLLDKLDIPDNFCLDSRQSNTQECFFFWSLMTNSCQWPGALFWFFFP